MSMPQPTRPSRVERAHAIADAFTGHHGPIEHVRRDRRLVLDGPPKPYWHPKTGEIVGVDCMVRLFDEAGQEIPVDPHRIIINPPVRVPDREVKPRKRRTRNGRGIEVRPTRVDPGQAFLDAVWESVDGTPHPKGWRTRGTVTTIYCDPDTESLEVESTSTTSFAHAAGGAVGWIFVAGDDMARVRHHFGGGTTYELTEGFLQFDTSSITDSDIVSSVSLEVYHSDGTEADDAGLDVEVFDCSWTMPAGGGSVDPAIVGAIWQTPTELSALTKVASVSGASIPDAYGYTTFTSLPAFLSVSNLKTGTVKLALAASWLRTNTPPTGDNWFLFDGWYYDVGPPEVYEERPHKLTITHAAPPPVGLLESIGGVSGTGIVEIALSSSTDTCGIWDTAEWDTDVWGPDEVWTDVTEWCRGFKTARRFSRDVQAWSAGSATVILDNRDGRFSPDNLDVSAPYVVGGVTSIRPGRPIRIRMTYGGTTYHLWRGYIDEWREGWVPAGSRAGDATMECVCSDEWARLAKVAGIAVSPSVGSGEKFGPRIHRLLDAAGHTGNRDIDSGTATMQATDLSDDPVAEMQLTADSEGGAVYIHTDGTVIGSAQYALVQDTRSINVQAEFGDGGGSEIPWMDIGVAAYSADMVVNIASYKRVGGTTQTVTDAISRALYGDCSDHNPHITSLVCETDAQALALASWRVSTAKEPEQRITSLTIIPLADPATLIPLALGLRIRDLVKVTRRPPSDTSHTMIRYCFISGIRHDLDNEGHWNVTWELASATTYQAFATSRWDTGLWGASSIDSAAARWFF